MNLTKIYCAIACCLPIVVLFRQNSK